MVESSEANCVSDTTLYAYGKKSEVQRKMES